MGDSVTKPQMLEYGKDREFGKATPGKIGMWIFLGTDAMSFCLLIAYGILRASAQSLEIA